jgi:hypothetical protein
MVGGLAAGAMLAGCGLDTPLARPLDLGDWPEESTDPTWRVLNRITFGPRPEERARAAEVGLEAFIEEQLSPEALDEGFGLNQPQIKVRRLETLNLDAPELFDFRRHIVTRELQQASLLRAVYSPRQLNEVMVDFWSNHFNVAQTKGDCAWLKTVDDRDVIRPHAMGKFHDLLYASAHSPAMLFYLDNQENHAGNPNENYARELMELHTLGVDGGYTQHDVQELARCLTGWSVKRHFYRGQYTFRPDEHDDGPKRVLDLAIPAGTKKAGGEGAIEMLAAHPATARFIAFKLARRFVADDPPKDLVAGAARTFLHTQGDIKAVLRAILLSSHMLAPTGVSPKLKRPLEFVASALRQLQADTDSGQPLLDYLARMGQPLFQWPTPDGFPDRAEAWSGSLLTRWSFALALVQGQIPGTALDLEALVEASGALTKTERLFRFSTLLLGRPLPPALAKQLLAADPEVDDERVLLAALLGSPAFQWR